MDPISHALMGAAAGLGLSGKSCEEIDARRGRWIAASFGALAGLAPDADRLRDTRLNPFGDDGHGLAYLLFHRGESHTLVAGFVFAGIVSLLSRALPGGFRLTSRRTYLIALAGFGLHLAMDATNDYGVHLFYPLSYRWFFGDFMFLVEPTVIAAILPYALVKLGLPRRHFGWVAAGWLTALFGIQSQTTWLRPIGFVFAAAALVIQLAFQWRRPRAGMAWGSLAVVLVVFFLGSRFARDQGRRAMSAQRPGETVADIVTTPAPSNPLCWRVITLTRDGKHFVARLGTFSILPNFTSPKTCYSPPLGRKPTSILDMPNADLADERQWSWAATFWGNIDDFEAQARVNDRLKATKVFYRVPFWGSDRQRPGHFLVGDMRFDYGNSVAEYCKYTASFGATECLPGPVPSWTPPFLDSPSGAEQWARCKQTHHAR